MSKIDDLRKKLRAMNIKGSNTLMLDKEYITELLGEIEKIETHSVAKTSEDEKNINKISSDIIHGGKF